MVITYELINIRCYYKGILKMGVIVLVMRSLIIIFSL